MIRVDWFWWPGFEWISPSSDSSGLVLVVGFSCGLDSMDRLYTLLGAYHIDLLDGLLPKLKVSQISVVAWRAWSKR